MLKIIFIFLMFAATVQGAMTRYQALSQLETGDNDLAIGPVGEVSRYSVRPDLWARYSHLPKSAAVNTVTALWVAQAIMTERVARFTRDCGHTPTDWEFALIWHCPGHVKHPNVYERDYATRFYNLVNH